jgi:hypothetical protein
MYNQFHGEISWMPDGPGLRLLTKLNLKRIKIVTCRCDSKACCKVRTVLFMAGTVTANLHLNYKNTYEERGELSKIN